MNDMVIGACGGGLFGYSITRFSYTGLLMLLRISCVNKGIASLAGAIGGNILVKCFYAPIAIRCLLPSIMPALCLFILNAVFSCGAISNNLFCFIGDLIARQLQMSPFPFHPHPAILPSLVTKNSVIYPWELSPSSSSYQSFIDTTILYGVSSLFVYKFLLGAKFRYMAPSDIIYAGAYAGASVPADSNDYANSSEKSKIQSIGDNFGCHHCGRRRRWFGFGPRYDYIGDHIPPNKYHIIASKHYAIDTQKFYPQCSDCCNIQARAVRMDQRALIFPRTFRRYDWWTPIPIITAFIALPTISHIHNNVSTKWKLREHQHKAKKWLKSWWPFN